MLLWTVKRFVLLTKKVFSTLIVDFGDADTRYCKGKESVKVVYAITSLCAEQADLKRLMQLWREHWGIKNQLHRTRDMTFDEDRSTVRKGHSPQIMAALRNTDIQIARKLNLPFALVTHIGARFPKRIIKILMKN